MSASTQREITTKAWIDFKTTLEYLKNPENQKGKNPILIQAEIDGVQSMIDDLEQQLIVICDII